LFYRLTRFDCYAIDAKVLSVIKGKEENSKERNRNTMMCVCLLRNPTVSKPD
jgi:hypothetical protein